MSHQHSQTQPGFHWNLHRYGGNFHLTIQCLNRLDTNAKHKVWLKPTSKMLFLYANHILKAKSIQDCRKLDLDAIVMLHRANIGEYLRMENQTKHLVED
ncbi:60S ribosome subunit biogenesis protein NIP7-like protein [Gossypium australe]|uniref:60S ribosome subunit biogenesis protein NIP7-like protein n=1 Tax=Gossypium australe TaxID=47621 RepID=A0A5B6WIK7_9ROSI|nr:60S ribosome subunit biogenesis protein NIP7-like protein [Gossypium australe]